MTALAPAPRLPGVLARCLLLLLAVLGVVFGGNVVAGPARLTALQSLPEIRLADHSTHLALEPAAAVVEAESDDSGEARAPSASGGGGNTLRARPGSARLELTQEPAPHRVAPTPPAAETPVRPPALRLCRSTPPRGPPARA